MWPNCVKILQRREGIKQMKKKTQHISFVSFRSVALRMRCSRLFRSLAVDWTFRLAVVGWSSTCCLCNPRQSHKGFEEVTMACSCNRCFWFIFVPFLTDSCGMGEPTVMNMSVRLDTAFHDDLRNHSSQLYRKYKADLDKAVMILFSIHKATKPSSKAAFIPCLSTWFVTVAAPLCSGELQRLQHL